MDSVHERVQELLAAPHDPSLLRQAITQEELRGVETIRTTKQKPPPLPVKSTSHTTVSLDRKKIKVTSQQPLSTKMKNGSLDESFEEGEDRFESCMDISASSVQQGSAADGLHKHPQEGAKDNSPGDSLLLDSSQCSSVTNPINKPMPVDSLKQFGSSKSVPNSPGGIIDSICCSSLSNNRKPSYNSSDGRGSPAFGRHEGTNNGGCSGSACVPNMTSSSSLFTYSPPTVRISKSEDQLQSSAEEGDLMMSVTTDLEDDITSSLNTLLDTRAEASPSSNGGFRGDMINTIVTATLSISNAYLSTSLVCSSSTTAQVRTAPKTTPSHRAPVCVTSSDDQHKVQCSALARSPTESAHSSHDSDSPLLHSPSPPHSPPSPSSSVAFSSSAVYDKIHNTRNTNPSTGNVCSHSSSSATSSPDTDIPDELEWDDSAPTDAVSNTSSSTKTSALTNGHNNKPNTSTSPRVRSSPRHVSIHPSANNLNLVNIDTSSSSSSSHVLQEKVRRKKDENRIVIKVAGPDKSSSCSTLGDSVNNRSVSRRPDSSCSLERTTKSRTLRKALSGEEHVMCDLTTKDSTAGVTAIISSSFGVGVIPGVDNDVTPTNTPQHTPLPSPSPSHSLRIGKSESQPRCIPRQSSNSRTSPPPQVSPQTPGSGTLSPETLAYQQLWESEDEFSTSCISEDDVSLSTSRSVGGGSVSQQSSSSQSGGTVGGGSSASVVLGTPQQLVDGEVASVKGCTSPTLSEDESDIESLHSFHYSPKAVDVPSAVRLAKRLYHLDGFKKTDVSRHLSKK